MHPDINATLILSLSIAAKRRPADLLDIVAAVALVQGRAPSADQLSDALMRLSVCGLVVDSDGGYTLSADAQQMLADQRNKDDNAKKLSRIAEHLAKYRCKGEHPAIEPGTEQLQAAIKQYKAENNSAGKNLLASKPKPKPAWIPKKDLDLGRQHLSSKQRRKP